MASIRERRRKDGSIYYSVLWRANGKQTSISVDSEKDADWIKSYIDLTGRLPDNLSTPVAPITVAELVERHIESLSGVQAHTITKYQAQARNHIDGPLGKMRAAAVTRSTVAKWINGLGRSPKTVKDVHALLSAAYRTGIREQIVTTNPAEGVRLPAKAKTRESVLIERGDFDVILSHAEAQWRPVFRLLGMSGIRWGEMAALTAKDFDLPRGVLTISKAVKRVDGSVNLIGPPKTSKSRRAVSLPASVLADLVPLLRKRGRIFAHLIGDGLRSDTTLDAWKRAVRAAKAAGLELRHDPVVHDIRHSHASWLLAANVPPKVVQERLGHETLDTTMRIYGHVSRDADAAAAALLDDPRLSAPARSTGSAASVATGTSPRLG